MNDRAVGVLENYELEVLRTWKGRGALLCESDKGLLILKEYPGSEEKILFQDALLTAIDRRGFFPVESILCTREGKRIAQDGDKGSYILKTYFEGRECNIRDSRECAQAVKTLALLHRVSDEDALLKERLLSVNGSLQRDGLFKEYERHNRELRKVRKFLKEKSQKTNFEIDLQKYYDYFFDLALQAAKLVERFATERSQEEKRRDLTACHGDYQYHNLLLTGSKMAAVNFEKCAVNHPMTDVYLFMRKLLEKNDWSVELGRSLLEAYNKERALKKEDYAELYYRLCYPEKFWKIVNFYFNSGKAWIPARNLEKLTRLMGQEEKKVAFLENYKSTYGSFSF